MCNLELPSITPEFFVFLVSLEHAWTDWLLSEFTEKFWTSECLSCCALRISIGCNICHVQRNAVNRRIPFLKMSIRSDTEPTSIRPPAYPFVFTAAGATGRFPGSASSSRLFSIGDACCLVLMWMGLNHMVSLSLFLAVLKNLVLSTLAANWSAPIVDSHHHQQVIFPLQAWLLVMYRKSKWKCGYDLAVLGHGEFTSAQLFSESKRFFLHPNFHRWKSWRES